MKKVFLIGDSHTKITFPIIAKVLSDKGYDVVDSVSNVGWATYSYIQNPEVLDFGLSQNPDIIIVSLGGNNHYLNDEKYGEKIEDFLDLIGYKNRKVVWISPFRATKEDVQKRHLWTHLFLEENLPKNIKYINVMEYILPLEPDGVHYPRSSYEDIISYIQDDILRAIQPSNVSKFILGSVVLGLFWFLRKK